MRKIATLAFLLALAAPALAQTADSFAPPSLKARASVASDVVRIGDLVDRAGDAANIAIFRSPDLGETGAVPVASVVAALRRHGVVGLDTRGLTEVSVTRASRAVTLEDIEARIARALAGKYGFGDAKDLTVTLNGDARSFHVEADVGADLEIARLGYDRRTRRFEALIEIPGSARAGHKSFRVAGTAADTMETAVLMRPLARGDVIRAADIAVEKRPRAEAAGDAIRGAQAAIGLAARRAIPSGQTLRNGDLMKPEFVTRNDVVTIIYQVPGVILTLRGKAQESGAEGDIVAVLNTQSKRVVHGTVTGPGRVSVNGLKPQLAANFSGDTANAARRRAE